MLASFIGATAMDGGAKLIQLAQDISIDGKNADDEKPRRLEEMRERKRREAAGDIPDAPEMVIAGEGVGLTDIDDSGKTGLSGPGSFEKAMMMFGPPLEPSPDTVKKIE